MKYAVFALLALLAMPVFSEAEALKGPPGAEAAVIGSAKDPDPAVRQAAATKLGEMHGPQAVFVLSTMATEDPDEAVRLSALGALSMIGDRGALPAYMKALRDSSEKVRRSAAEALSGIWDDNALKALAEALRRDPSPKVRQRVAETLGNPGVMGRYDAHHWDKAQDTEFALTQALKEDESYEVRATSALMLSKFKDEKTLDPLLDAMEDKYAPVRAAAAESLGALDSQKAVDRLLDVLYFEKEDSVIVSALRALKYTNDPRLAEPVVKALRSGSQKVRWQAIDVIETLRPPESKDALREIAADRYESDGVRTKAREALELMGER